MLLPATKHSGSLKQVSLKKQQWAWWVLKHPSQRCDYWRLPSLICVIPIFSDSWVRALRGTTLSGSLPKPSCWKGSKSLLSPQLDTAWQLQVVSSTFIIVIYFLERRWKLDYTMSNVLCFTCRCHTVLVDDYIPIKGAGKWKHDHLQTLAFHVRQNATLEPI